MAKSSKALKLVKDPDAPVAAELLEQAIVDIGDAMKRIQSTRLTRKAIIVLIADDTKLGKGIVDTVFSSLEQLDRTYLKAR